MSISDYLKTNTKHGDAATIHRALPHYTYHFVWRVLNGETEPKKDILAEAVKIFKERKKHQDQMMQLIDNK